jgi:hypothetical protein
MRRILIALALLPAAAHAEPPGLTDPTELAEARFHHLRLHLVDDDRGDGGARRFDVVRGVDPGPIDMEDFYREVGRPDLAQAHHGRRVLAIASVVGGVALFGAATYYLIRFVDRVPDLGACDAYLSSSQFGPCLDDAQMRARADADRAEWPMIGTALGSALAFTVAAWYFARPEPITRDEARGLAAAHDRDLRYRLGLVPYVDDRGGGLSVTGSW